MIEIKNRWNGSVIYTAENAQDVRAVVLDAIKAKANLSYADLRYANLRYADLRYANLRDADLSYADLRYADLSYANLRYANLRYADLRYANLRYADLRYANLRDADLSYADLRYADLSYANLRYANLSYANLRYANLRYADLRYADLRDAIDGPHHPLWLFRQDYWSILDQAPAEVAGLRKAIVAGKINGSVYEGTCACLSGTIANVHGCNIDDLTDELGIVTDASRPAEQWYIMIVEGDKPLPFDTKGWPSESVFRLSYALAWLDEWKASRESIAKGLGFTKKRKAAKKAAKKS